jgi:hypothetical protein
MISSDTRRDYYAGALCVLFGLGVVIVASGYNVGSLREMGPGFFPIMLGLAMMLMGVLIVGAAIFGAPEPPDPFDQHMPETPDWRGCFCILSSVVLFIVTASWFGMAPAIFLSVFAAALGDRTSSIKGAGALAAGVSVFGVILFGYFLKVSMPVWLWFGK